MGDLASGVEGSRRGSTPPGLTLCIVIVNWNSGERLRECLSCIDSAAKTGVRLEFVAVVDNGSGDSSAKGLALSNAPLVVISNERNVGFAAACNQGAKGSRADVLLFMNPDVLLGENALSVPVQFLSHSSSRRVAVCGPRLVGGDGSAQRTCSRFPSPANFYWRALALDRLLPGIFQPAMMTEWAHDCDRTVDQVMGACFFIRRNVFEEMGGFDERFFVYFEELDLCLRCHKAGWETRFLSAASAVHEGGGCSKQALGKRLFYSLRSRLLYGFKHFSMPSAFALCLVTAILEPFSRLVLAVARRSREEVRGTLEGYRLLWSSLPSTLKQARGVAGAPGSAPASGGERNLGRGIAAETQRNP